MAKAFSMPTEWELIRRVDAEARRIWQYGDECFSEAWLRAYEALRDAHNCARLQVL